MRRLLCLALTAACSPGTAETPHVPDPPEESAAPKLPASGAVPTSTSTASATPGITAESSTTQAAEPAARLVTLFVHEQRVDCEGERPQKCLQVRENPAEEWTYFYDEIAGFQYEESYRYELEVTVQTRPNPAADQSSLSYRLVEVISKQKMAPGSRQ